MGGADGLYAPAAPRHDTQFRSSAGGGTLAPAGASTAARDAAASRPAEIEEGYWRAMLPDLLADYRGGGWTEVSESPGAGEGGGGLQRDPRASAEGFLRFRGSSSDDALHCAACLPSTCALPAPAPSPPPACLQPRQLDLLQEQARRGLLKPGWPIKRDSDHLWCYLTGGDGGGGWVGGLGRESRR